jgi:hypothetical protein
VAESIYEECILPVFVQETWVIALPDVYLQPPYSRFAAASDVTETHLHAQLRAASGTFYATALAGVGFGEAIRRPLPPEATTVGDAAENALRAAARKSMLRNLLLLFTAGNSRVWFCFIRRIFIFNTAGFFNF